MEPMRKLILMSLVFVIALSMNGLTWAQGQGQRGQALAGQAQARGGQRSTYRGKAMPPTLPARLLPSFQLPIFKQSLRRLAAIRRPESCAVLAGTRALTG